MKIVLVLLLLACSCTPKQKSDSEIIYNFDTKTNELLIKVRLPEGKHAYAPGEPIGKPVELVIHSTNKWELASQPVFPIGNKKHLIDHSFEIKAKLKNGQGPISGIFKMQLCSDSSCERPVDYGFQIN
ncbi:MAG: hypothetical protein WCK49_08975 [Myxococcaceae bacterium]